MKAEVKKKKIDIFMMRGMILAYSKRKRFSLLFDFQN